MNTSNEFLDSILSVSIAPVLLGTLLFVVVVLAVLFVLVLNLGAKMRNLTYPVYDQVIKKGQQEADRVIRDAGEQARAIRAKAEMEAGKLLVDRKKENEVLRDDFVKQFNGIASHSQEVLNQQVEITKQASDGIVNAIKAHSKRMGEVLKEEDDSFKQIFVEERDRANAEMKTFVESMKTEQTAFLNENKQRVSEAIGEEIENVRASIKTYRDERFSVIDKQIVKLVEDTARLSLGRAISMEQHADIIQESLREAKAQGIFEK